MYSIGSRVMIVAGFFASAEAQALANEKGISFQPTGTVVYSNMRTLEHRVQLDVALFTSPVVTCLGIEDLQLITPTNKQKKSCGTPKPNHASSQIPQEKKPQALSEKISQALQKQKAQKPQALQKE